MCENGRIRHHLKNNITDPANTVVLVGFMAENTLGRRIKERRATVNIFGEPYPLNAHVEDIDGFSAHADHQGLLTYFQAVGERAEQVVLVHGEMDSAEALAKELGKRTGAQIVIPEPGTSLTVAGTN